MKEWSVPEITELEVEMTEAGGKKGGAADGGMFDGIPLGGDYFS
jgi:hypothetical protein